MLCYNFGEENEDDDSNYNNSSVRKYTSSSFKSIEFCPVKKHTDIDLVLQSDCQPNAKLWKARINNLDPQSSSSTVLTKHVDNKLNQQFSKGNINLGKSPKLVPCDNQIIWGSSTKEIKTSFD